MRASSLSQPEVIDLLTRYFVPVVFSVDGYGEPQRDRAEEEEFARIRHRARELSYPTGTVCVYLLAPDGDVLGTLGVERAEQPAQLLALLRRTVELHRVRPRDPGTARPRAAVSPAPPGAKTDGGHVLHVWTVPEGKSTYQGASHDWVELESAEWRTFLPPAGAQPGDTWQIPRPVIDRFARYCYPLVPNYRADASRVRSASLTATVTAVRPGAVEIALEGRLHLGHALAAKKGDGDVVGRLVGVAVADTRRGTLSTLEILADRAEYVWHWQQEAIRSQFAAVVQLVP
jgi:hypothetical protein